MADLWRWLISLLVWLSADPDAITCETPKAAAAVAVAYAALAPEPAPDTPPKPVGPVNATPDSVRLNTQPCLTGTCHPR